MSASVVQDDTNVVHLTNEESNNTNQDEVTKVPTTTSTTLYKANHIVGDKPTPPSEKDETKVPTTNSTTTDHSTTNNISSTINVNSAAEHKTTKVPINTETTTNNFIIDHQQQINHNDDQEMSNVNNNQIEVRMSDPVNEGVTENVIRYAHYIKLYVASFWDMGLGVKIHKS